MPQPSSKPEWVPSDDPAKIIEPSASKKNTGWASEEKPPFQYFNWFWNNLSKWIDWFNGTRKYNIVISSDSDEANFSSLEAYISGTPVSGDRVLVKNDQTLTATLTLPADVEVTIAKSKKFSLSTVFTPIINIGDRSALKGDWKVEANHVGTIAKGVVFNGDDAHVENIHIENTTTGVITTAIEIAAAKEGNLGQCQATNTGAGSITAAFLDSSGVVTNLVFVRTDTKIESPSLIPSGLISIWSGAISAIPSGWQLCDGSGSSPDLTDRFVIHADADAAGTHNVGDLLTGTGASDNHTLITSEMPAHGHDTPTYDTDSGSATTIRAGAGSTSASSTSGSTGGDGAHNHVITDYKPKSYALAYIMKL